MCEEMEVKKKKNRKGLFLGSLKNPQMKQKSQLFYRFSRSPAVAHAVGDIAYRQPLRNGLNGRNKIYLYIYGVTPYGYLQTRKGTYTFLCSLQSG